MPLHLEVAIPTLVGSALSCIATTIVAVLYILFPPEWHFRQALILNLLIADWMNSLNNTISGSYALAHRDKGIAPGAACTINGYVGQFSVQAIDFNILIVSISVLVTIRKKTFVVAPTRGKMLGVCAMAWIPSIITSNIALGLNAYGSVSGNWCWIKPQYTDLRYALTHSWRMAIFFITIGIYTYVYIHLARFYDNMQSVGTTTHDNEAHDDEVELTAVHDPPRVPEDIHKGSTDGMTVNSSTSHTLPGSKHEYQVTTKPVELPRSDSTSKTLPPPSPRPVSRPQPPRPAATMNRRRTRDLRKMLLLNGYPLLYIALWIPGIMNRLWESTTGKSPLWLQALQSSTQYIGLGNTITLNQNALTNPPPDETLRPHLCESSALLKDSLKCCGMEQPGLHVPLAKLQHPRLTDIAIEMSDIKATETIVYKTVGDLEISFDLYLSDNAKNVPVFLWFHGGGLIQGHRNSLTPSMRKAVKKHALAVISADYRLAPQASADEILSDVQDCVSFIRTKLSSAVPASTIDTTRLAVSGSSAGGYLALLAGLYVDPKPNVIAPIYPITDPLGTFFTNPQPPAMGRPFVELETVAPFLDPKSPQVANNDGGDRSSMYIRMQHDANLAKLLRIPEGKDADKWRVSKQIYARRTPPAYVLHGDADTAVGVEQADEVVGAMVGCGIEVVYERPHGKDHFLDAGADYSNEAFWVFVKQHL
ncbi:uncharacterized protein MYCGRDRAFT_109455 [Zymoseptoria tritici IPO323]|uniref:Alpha/beta hydrolase fold-3 domain-containing protein n=1 Tax=Zymoseptoria tritici (strain CBS 115943 / IPO323) TaxID=336722 RepID=F9XBX7_ZYMTI|nr:uncharacterized protein MYCGRDRAFT_109455 [Zymoseptoria tritici IPO323]EGP87642.1 hypothetical protein MYCGRDRAFT_109455 [Zymoseptoria tritici IPO323]